MLIEFHVGYALLLSLQVNWGGTAGSNHYAKITAGHEWLHEDGDEEDIVLTIDAYVVEHPNVNAFEPHV
jgi:hypothetical protein